MRILFVENRQKTYLWDKIAAYLQSQGHEIFWIIQNHMFKPKNGLVYCIPYPSKWQLSHTATHLKKITNSDRNLLYYGYQSSDYYNYYYSRFEEIFLKVQPQLVIGESTLFHELLIIELCKKLNVLFLQPTSARYPTGRFVFLQFDGQEPFAGLGDGITEDSAGKMIDSICNRTIQLDYMKKTKQNKFHKMVNKFYNYYLLFCAYYHGERYNTPSPVRKLILDSAKRKLVKKWDGIAKTRYPYTGTNFRLLYPMHMQPESTLDVWGWQYQDQKKLLETILAETNSDIQIIVKPNPKPLYELSDDLITFIQDNPRIIPCPFSISMKDVLKEIHMILTVTGTVAIEAIFSNIPVVTLINTGNNNNVNCPYLETPKLIMKYIEMVKQGKFPKISTDDQISYLNILNKSSYPGLINDPYNDPSILCENNLKLLYNAFDHVISRI